MWRISFTHLGALWLGAAAVLPLIIHFLWRQRPKVIRFPAVRFIRLSQRKSFRRTRFKHLLLLLLRMALIALFAALIARPILHKGQRGAAGAAGADRMAAAVLILDDSLSMAYRAGDATWFDAARNRALELVAGLPEGAAAAVLTTSHPQGKLTRQLDSVANRVAGLRATARSNSCWRALETAAEILRQEAAPRRDVFLFTDMTQSAWVGHERRRLQLGPEINLYVVDCAADDAANAAVYEMRQTGEPTIVGGMLSLQVRVLASGAPLERTVQFELDGKAVDRRRLDLEAGSETTLRLRALLSESGHHWGRVAFLNPDGLPQDDARTFTVEVAPEVSVLCVEDEPELTLESASYFFRLALNPWGEEGRGIFRVERVSPAGLADLPLSPFDAVALVAAAGMNEAAWRRLDAYVAGGGGVLAFLGPGTADTYRSAAARAVLPAQVGAAMVAPPESPFGLRIVRPGHPLVRAIMDSRATLAQARYRQCRRLTPAPDAVELMSFGPDLPALVLSEVGGKVALFAGTADERWGEFAKTEPFTPFCHELLLYLAGRSAEGIRSVPVGAHVPITFETSRWPTIVYVTSPDAKGPERLLPGTTPGRHTYRRTDAPGYYRVDFERQDKEWRGGFAVNTVSVESRLDEVPFEKVQASVRAGKVELVAEASFGEGEIEQAGGARELTPYLALLALAFLVAECFLANRFYGAGRASPPKGE